MLHLDRDRNGIVSILTGDGLRYITMVHGYWAWQYSHFVDMPPSNKYHDIKRLRGI